MSERKSSCLLWPFELLWNLVAGIVTITGRLVAVILGMALLLAGGC